MGRKKKIEDIQQDTLTQHTLRIHDLFAPDSLSIEYDHLRLGHRYTRIYALHAIPRRVQVGWLDEVFDAGDVDLSVQIMPVPDRDVIRTLISKENTAQSQLILDQKSGNISRLPELETQVSDYRALRDAIQLGQDRLYYLTFLIAVHGSAPEELRQRCDVVETVLARRGVLPRMLIMNRQVEGFRGILPLAKSSLHDYERNLTSGATACCLPMAVSSGGHSTGIMLGVNLFTKTPVFLDRFAGEHVISNPHMFICGETGSGKSVCKREIMLLEAYRGAKIADIDPEGEDAYFIKSIGGQVISLRPGRFSGMNPLEVEPEFDENERLTVNVLSKIEDARALVGSVFNYYQQNGMGVVEAALLEEAVREDYRERGITDDPESLYENGLKKPMPTLSSVRERIMKKPNGSRLADAMTPLLAGGTVGMFDGQTSAHLADVPAIGFDLSALSGDFPRLISICAALNWLWQTFAQKGGKKVPKSITVDETWMFMRQPEAALYLETLARRGRKHGCGLTIATQKFQEFSDTKEGLAVIDSCATRLILKQEDHAVQAVIDYFKLASGCAGMLTHAKPGQGVLCASGQTTALQVQPAPFEWDFVETKLRARS